MKKINIYLSLAGIIVAAMIAGCGENKPAKITDVPASTQSKEAEASFRQGLVYMDQGDGQKARADFSKAIELDPKLAIAYIFRSGNAQTAKEFADDVNKAKTNLEGASDFEKMYVEYYETFLTSDWNKRLQIIQKMASTYPDAARPQVELGFTYAGGNDHIKARECFVKAVSIDSAWVGGYGALFTSYLFNDPKDFAKAEQYAMKVVQLAPSSPGAEIGLGDCYRAQKNLEKARDAYAKAISLDTNQSEAYYKKGHANTFLGNLEEARKDYMNGSRHDESKVGALQFIAYTYLYAGDPKTALTWLSDQAAKMDASSDSKNNGYNAKNMVLSDCANIAMFNNDAAKFQEFIAMNEPLNDRVAQDIGTTEAKLTTKAGMLRNQALLAAMQGNNDLAKAKAEEMKSTVEPLTDPTKLEGYETVLGYIAMKQKHYTEAITHLEKSAQNSLLSKYWLAMAYEGAGNKDKAKALYNEIADNNFNGLEYALIRNEVKKKVGSM